MAGPMRITFLGNHAVDYSSEAHHCKSLESLGHDVIRLQEGKAQGQEVLAEAEQSDMLVVVHTHGWGTPGLPIHQVLEQVNAKRIPTVTYHLDLWMGLQRQRDLQKDPFYRQIGHFFTVDQRMADWMNNNTPVKGHFLPAGVFHEECYISEEPSVDANDVIFVGSKRYHSEWLWRPQLIDFLRRTYGSRFTHVGGDGDTGTKRGDELNRIYANSKVAVGDTLCLGFDYPWYHSDRLWEASGRGAAQVFPYIPGIDTWFSDNVHLKYFKFGDFDDLRSKIDWMLDNEKERETIRKAGHEMVKASGTYRHRWQHILDVVFNAT